MLILATLGSCKGDACAPARDDSRVDDISAPSASTIASAPIAIPSVSTAPITPVCRSCAGLRVAGPHSRFQLETHPIAHEDRHPKPSQLDLYDVDHGSCCLSRSSTLSPGLVLEWVDGLGTIYLRRIDAAWGAFATFGLFAYSVDDGSLSPVVRHMASDYPCKLERGHRIAAFVRVPSETNDGWWDATFTLELVDLQPGRPPNVTKIAVEEMYKTIFPDALTDTQRDQIDRLFRWSAGCSSFRYRAPLDAPPDHVVRVP